MPLEDVTKFTSALLKYHFDYNLEHVILLKIARRVREIWQESRQDMLENVINVKMGKSKGIKRDMDSCVDGWWRFVVTEKTGREVIVWFFGGRQHIMITSVDAKGKSEKNR